jgi:hypothetical protein
MAYEIYLIPVLTYVNETWGTPNENKHKKLQTETRATFKQ